MKRQMRVLVGLVWLLGLLVACGGPRGECSSIDDCVTLRGPGYQCVLRGGAGICEQREGPQSCPASCTSDTDCNACDGGRTSCTRGVCKQAEQASSCQEACASDVECRACKDGKNKCIAGTCSDGTKPPQCPSSCQKDADCTSCAADKRACVQGSCTNKTSPTCPGSCSLDADCLPCGADKQQCVKGVCGKQAPPQCPSSCQKDADCTSCAAERRSCIQGICAEKTAPNCPASCQKDADCSPCGADKKQCVKGVCGQSTNPTCPATCQVDGDCAVCAQDKRACVKGVCGEKVSPHCPQTCATNTDCLPCAADKQQCIKGMCSKQAPPQCPSSCQNDTDCKPCAANKQQCIQGACAEKPNPTCPALCSIDADCLPCGADKKLCIKGVCGKQAPPQCPASCQKDIDCKPCGANKQQCVQGVCGQVTNPTCPASCQNDTDCSPCAANKRQCLQGICSQKTGPTCPSSCKSTQDCQACGVGFQCQSGTCQQQGSKAPGAACQAPKDCAIGYTCFGVSGQQGFCVQDCTSKSSLCQANTDGRTLCYQSVHNPITGRSHAVCLARVAKGQACGLRGKTQALCAINQPKPLYCSQVSQRCVEVVVRQKAGERCNLQGDLTEPYSICDATKALICDNGGACIKVTTAQEGEACDPSGQILGKKIHCDPAKRGLTCYASGVFALAPRCHYPCQAGAASQCGHRTGLGCAAKAGLYTSQDICLDTTCQTDSDCAFSGYKCQKVGSGRVCLPPPITGPKAYGEQCAYPLPTQGCAKQLSCIQTSGQSKGVCASSCAGPGATCPSVGKNTSLCASIQGVHLCMVTCDAQTPCPNGLKCLNVGLSKSICLAQ